MALPGREPKPAKHGRSQNAEWTTVPNRPFEGPSPDLPKLTRRRKWREEVSAWWEELRRMPHCVLWTDTDWRFAVETAFMKQQFWIELDDGEMKTTTATEIRRREDQMGTTGEARRKLRIRYEDLAEETPPSAAPAVGPAGVVTSLDDRRRRLTG